MIPLTSCNDIAESRRRETAALRLRILGGDWEADLAAYIASHIDPTRAVTWGRPSKAVNLLRSVVGQLSVTYDEPPTISHPDAPDLGPLDDLFHLHPAHEDNVLAARESLIRVGWAEATHLSPGGLTVRLVTSDTVIIDSAPGAPGVPAVVREMRIRHNPESNKPERFWDVWNVTDADAPRFTIEAEDGGRDMTSVFAPEMVNAYPFIDAEGRPFLPFILYHARDNGKLWDPYAWDELVSGTLAVALYYTFFNHAVKDASWVQKFGINIELQGANADGENIVNRARIPVDPASLLMFKTTGGEPGSLGSFPLPADPLKLIEAIQVYQGMVFDALGIAGDDVQEAQSGAALKIRNDKVRALAARTEPQFRKGDIELLSKAAKIWNIYSGKAPLPEEGYQIAYHGVPMSHDELTLGLDRDLRLVSEGLLSKVDILMRMTPGITREQAAARLAVIAAENATAPAATVPAPVPVPVPVPMS